MGNIVASLCRKCGFTNKFSFGGGRFSYQTNCPVPAINKETLEFENVNYFEYQNSEVYMFYTDDILKSKTVDSKSISNFNLYLNEENNYCPQCKEKELAFRVVAFTD